MVFSEFFISRITFPVGATAIILVLGALVLYFGRIMEGILVEEQDRTDKQILGVLFLFKNIIFPASIVGIYLTQETFPVFSFNSLYSLIGLIGVGGFYHAQNNLHRMNRFGLHKSDKFEDQFTKKLDEVLPDQLEEIFIENTGMKPLEFFQEDIDLAIKFVLSKTMFYGSSFLFVFFLYQVVVSGSLPMSILALVLAFSGITQMAQSWAYYYSDDIWSHVETDKGEVFEGKLISRGDNYVLWAEEEDEKIEIKSENIATIRQSRWKDEKLEFKEEE
ncbi:MAG: hypothetical protein ABEJ95_07555 [Candidatus Nanohalobium sp.]